MHSSSHTNNGFFKLVEPLKPIHSYFFSHSMKLCGLPLSAVIVSSHYRPRCLRAVQQSHAVKRLLPQLEVNLRRFVAVLLLHNKNQQ